MRYIVRKEVDKYVFVSDFKDEPIRGGIFTIREYAYVDSRYFEKLSIVIRNLFESAIINSFEPMSESNAAWSIFHVNFSNKADEAHFLLWSSDGIEI